MILEVTENLKFLKVVEATELEISQLEISLTKKVKDYWFMMKKNPKLKKWGWKGEVKFFDKYQRIPLGLWHEVIKICETYNFEIEINGLENIIDSLFDEDEFNRWQEDFFKNSEKKPRDFQIKAAINIIKYGWSCSEIATSAGKTLIVFMVFSYLKTHNLLSKMLIVVPNNSLVLQGMEDFEEYSQERKLIKYKIQPIGDGAPKDKKDVDIIIGTFQTLCKLDPSFFEGVNVLCTDEAHFGSTKSVKDVISKCINADIRFGLSGTLGIHKDDASSYTILALLGPLVNKITASYLFGNNKGSKRYATPVFIRQIYMDYLPLEARDYLLKLKIKSKSLDDGGTKMYALEKDLILNNKDRLDFIIDVISKVQKNSLVLFNDVKNQYGKQIYDTLREVLPKNYEIFYIDGETKTKQRTTFIDKMDEESDTIKIMVASYGCFSTGISVNNLWYVFFTESYKSEKIILQSVGRGMRLMEGKEVINIIDFVDNFTYKTYRNYALNHAKEREDLYIGQGFPYKKIYKTF